MLLPFSFVEIKILHFLARARIEVGSSRLGGLGLERDVARC